MKTSLRLLNAIGRSLPRSRSTSFIGLGRMGHEMAYNLFSKQFAQANESQFVVCDAIPESTQSFCSNFIKQYPGANISIANTPEEATLASQTIITMLPSSPQVLSVYNDGIIPTLRKLPAIQAHNTLCIDSTTLDVDVARSVAKYVTEAGSQMVDAPVSGGVTGAKAATLAFLVGGTITAFEKAQPLLALMGQRIIHCGPSSAGLGAKICNNLILGVQQIVVGEAMLLGTKLGLDPAVLSSVISSSTGNCWSISVNNPVPHALPEKSPPCEREYEGGFATALMLKDMGLASNVAALAGCPVPLGQTAEALYARMIEERPDLARKDFSSVYRFLEKAMEEGNTVKPGVVLP
ncbi:3-hydroxyisobutyrate dehydrogenase [Lentinula aciculospora]|uniref:3-hydroxyisobutyrate dehydrogenase n=1 Tax=Lentinula aciculospora TaxID=153920 RepID=A0A9W9AR05_9AGAR|nr:3-hydroxyisobutyrate dehydrogenase [Lentinula aciculospora]